MYIYEVYKLVQQHPHVFKKVIEMNSVLKITPYLKVPSTRTYMKIYNKLPGDIKQIKFNEMTAELYNWIIVKNYYNVSEHLEQ